MSSIQKSPGQPFTKSKGQVVRPMGSPTLQIQPAGGGTNIDFEQPFSELLGVVENNIVAYIPIEVGGVEIAVSVSDENLPGKQSGSMNIWLSKVKGDDGIDYDFEQNHLLKLGIFIFTGVEFFVVPNAQGERIAVCLSKG